MPWPQNYDPLGNAVLSTLVAALPTVVLLGAIAGLKLRIHLAAFAGLAVALLAAVWCFHFPVSLAAATTLYGAASGLFPIGWIILNLLFLYQLTVERGLFAVLRQSLASLAPDPRIQVILIAFSFGAFFEGAAGFGTPVAVTSAILMQLGFSPLSASGLSLIANTAPVAFGALGTPIIALSKASGISELELSAMVGRQLPFFSLIVPFWVVWAMAGFRATREIWPAALTAGLAFAVPQFLVANFIGPSLVDIIAALCSILAVAVLLRFWRPKNIWRHEGEPAPRGAVPAGRAEVWRAWLPWILLTLFVFLWGLPAMKAGLNQISAPAFKVPALHLAITRAPPVAVAAASGQAIPAEEAIYKFEWLSATGTGILAAALVAGVIMGYAPGKMLRIYIQTFWRARFSLLTIAAMLALGYVTKYSGMDVTLGLSLAHTGWLYPFFGTMLGWLGVALTGSDTASNVLFGGLQRITAIQTGISPTLMAAANSSGGVMGKMVDAQSIVVASTATNWYGHEGKILRFVFGHSLALAVLMGVLVFLQATVWPFNLMTRNLPAPVGKLAPTPALVNPR